MSDISEDVFLTSALEYLIALSGSFKPFPVNIHTIFEPFLTWSFTLIRPATDAALAGSARTPSVEAIRFVCFYYFISSVN